MNDSQEHLRWALFILVRAIREDSSYYYYEDLKIDKSITDTLDRYTGHLFDLWDEHLNAADRGDMEESWGLLGFIANDPLLGSLFIYYFAGGKYARSSDDECSRK